MPLTNRYFVVEFFIGIAMSLVDVPNWFSALTNKLSILRSDDFIYVTVLVTSVWVGLLLRRSSSAVKQHVSVWAAPLLLCTLTGWDCLHSMATVAGSALLWRLSGIRWRHQAIFVFCFAYLAFFRLGHTLVAMRRPLPLANAVQLLITLRLVGLAFEYRDCTHPPSEPDAAAPPYRSLGPTDFTAYRMLAYSYCFLGLFTGPFYRYQTFCDWLRQTPAAHRSESVWRLCRATLARLAVVTLIYLALSRFVGLRDVLDDDFVERAWAVRVLYMTPVFTLYKMRVYVAWLLAYVMCLTAGLGCYPASCCSEPGLGPTRASADGADQPVDYRTVQNVDVMAVEFSRSYHTTLRAWNSTVQFWMAHHVFRRLPWRRGRALLTMVVSAYWHGFGGGFYMSFLNVPVCFHVEAIMTRWIGQTGAEQRGAAEAVRGWRGWVLMFLKNRAFDYMGIAFLLASARHTFNYWRCTYFCVHVMWLGIIVLDYVARLAGFRPRIAQKAAAQ